jgi:hypothetical protein
LTIIIKLIFCVNRAISVVINTLMKLHVIVEKLLTHGTHCCAAFTDREQAIDYIHVKEYHNLTNSTFSIVEIELEGGGKSL